MGAAYELMQMRRGSAVGVWSLQLDHEGSYMITIL